MQSIGNVPHESRFVDVRGFLLCALLLLLGAGLVPNSAQAQAWTLNQAQRQAYLNYYAPVILQRAEEDSSKPGRDWISNYDFDRDSNFSNNRYTWANVLSNYVAAGAAGSGAYQNWRIRPTLYSSMVEYMDNGSKGVLLLFHVFHPVDKMASQIHDWERIEISVRGVTGTPGGAGEVVGHVTVTSHSDHVMRSAGSSDLKFMQVATGKHVLIWQADEDTGYGTTHAHELHFVQDSYSTISASVASNGTADVDVTNDDDKNVHYVWVPEASSAAVSAWNAKPISYSSASSLASRRDSQTSWSQVKRITYELQDMADVFATQWGGSTWSTSWTADSTEDVLLDSPIVNEAGVTEVPAGLQRFYLGSRDAYSSDGTDGRDGVIAKSWFWGAYSAEANADDFTSGSDDFGGYDGAGRDSFNRTRATASGDAGSIGNYWRQHDFFVHSGVLDTREHYEAGIWLVGAWYLPENGGFDGRWAQLFDDRRDYEAPPVTPPTCPVNGATQCEIKGGTWNATTCTCKVVSCPSCQIP
ncbi:hypothetical protein [Lysobacter tyrosinilyticus]